MINTFNRTSRTRRRSHRWIKQILLGNSNAAYWKYIQSQGSSNQGPNNYWSPQCCPFETKSNIIKHPTHHPNGSGNRILHLNPRTLRFTASVSFAYACSALHFSRSPSEPTSKLPRYSSGGLAGQIELVVCGGRLRLSLGEESILLAIEVSVRTSLGLGCGIVGLLDNICRQLLDRGLIWLCAWAGNFGTLWEVDRKGDGGIVKSANGVSIAKN